MSDTQAKALQIAPRNNFPVADDTDDDCLERWRDLYFEVEVTTAASSRRVQQRDIRWFIEFVRIEAGEAQRLRWTPRLSRSFHSFLQSGSREDGRSRWSDRSINRILAHVKTFAGFVHRMRPFPLGNPMAKIRLQAVGNGLDVERAVTPQERNQILDAADTLPALGARSKDRNRYKGGDRPQRKNFRPYRNRAIVYLLMETGLRRAAVTHLDLSDVGFWRGFVRVLEKGGYRHEYRISREGLEAIWEYVEKERATDAGKWPSPALFLPAETAVQGTGRLNVKTVNTVWNQVCALAQVSGRTPHSARHAMGKYLVEKTGNIAAVQRQLGHHNAAYSMQYARITGGELSRALDERG